MSRPSLRYNFSALREPRQRGKVVEILGGKFRHNHAQGAGSGGRGFHT